MNSETVLECRNLSHWFGKKKVLHGINLKVNKGQFVALVGPSGCGKSTLLNSIMGVMEPAAGEVLIYRNGGCPAKVRGPNRDCGMVDQQYLLYPNRTALRNVSIGPKFDEASLPFRLFHPLRWNRLKKIHHARALEMLDKVGLKKDANSMPRQLSGGMRQRVAIAQALIMKPKILLLDEPFGALDEATRENLQRLLLGLYVENQEAKKRGEDPPYTVLIVTHEINEAIYVADRVVGLSQNWDWKKYCYDEHPGAIIVYDEPAPVFKPDDPRDFMVFQSMKDKIFRLVIDEKICEERDQYLRMLNHLGSDGGNDEKS